METRTNQYIPDYEDPTFIIDDAEASMEGRIIRELLPPFSEWSVDLGCGYGRLSAVLAKRSRKLILVDYSLANMKRAKERMLHEGISASFLLADISHLPFRSGSIDTVAMFRVFHHFSDPGLAMREIVRCMKPYGNIVFNYDSSDNASMILFWLKHKINGGKRHQKFPFPLVSGTLRGSSESIKRPIYFQTHSTVRNIMRQNGLVPSPGAFHSGMLGMIKGNNRLLSQMARNLQARMVDKWPSRFLFPNNYLLCRKKGYKDNTEFHNLEDLLACPVCYGTISIKNGFIGCENGHLFSVVDGIYDFRNPS